MIPLSRQGAMYFCKNFSASGVSTAADMPHLYNSVLNRKKTFKEGDGIYEQYRDALLREADRSFFMAITCFRRALDMFTAASVFWAHVSLYYSSWYAAGCALGMFGCHVLGRRGKFRIVIEAKTHAPGQQEFLVEKYYSTMYSGGHQMFWDAYYRAMKNAIHWTEARLQLAVTPISNNNIWPIDRRNSVNYHSLEAFKLMRDYTTNFDEKRFPDSLQGDIVTQFNLSRALLLFCATRAKEFGLNTDTYADFSSRASAIRRLIYRTVPPKLSKYSEESSLTI